MIRKTKIIFTMTTLRWRLVTAIVLTAFIKAPIVFVEAFSKRITLPIKVTLHCHCSTAAFHDFIFSKIHAAFDSLVYVKFYSESVEIVFTLHGSELRHKAPHHKSVDDQLLLASVGGHPSRKRCQNYRNRDGSRAELVHEALILSFESSQRACTTSPR